MRDAGSLLARFATERPVANTVVRRDPTGTIAGYDLHARNLRYTWPDTNQVGALLNDGQGALSWGTLPPGVLPNYLQLAGATYGTIQEGRDLYHSAGWVSGGVISGAIVPSTLALDTYTDTNGTELVSAHTPDSGFTSYLGVTGIIDIQSNQARVKTGPFAVWDFQSGQNIAQDGYTIVVEYTRPNDNTSSGYGGLLFRGNGVLKSASMQMMTLFWQPNPTNKNNVDILLVRYNGVSPAETFNLVTAYTGWPITATKRMGAYVNGAQVTCWIEDLAGTNHINYSTQTFTTDYNDSGHQRMGLWVQSGNVADHFIDNLRVYGGAYYGAGTPAGINVTLGAGSIRALNSPTAPLYFFDWSAASGLTAPTTGNTKYVGVEYNAGAPQAVVRDTYNWNFNTDFPLGSVYNNAGTLEVTNDPLSRRIPGALSVGGSLTVGGATVVTGAGTLDTIAKFTATGSAVGDSRIVDTGASRILVSTALELVHGSGVPASTTRSTNPSGPSGGSGWQCGTDDGAAMAAGDKLGFITFYGAYDAAGSRANQAEIAGFATSTWTGSSRESYLSFLVTDLNSVTRIERLRLNYASFLVTPLTKFSDSVICKGSLVTTATAGFLYLPSCAGPPTGTPDSQAGTIPLVYDSTNNNLRVYNGGAWRTIVTTLIGKLLRGFATRSTPTSTTSATLVDVPSMTTTLTLVETSTIFAVCTFGCNSAVAGGCVIEVALNIDGTDYQFHQRALSGSSDQGMGSVTYMVSGLTAGARIVKMRFRRVSGSGTPQITSANLFALAI